MYTGTLSFNQGDSFSWSSIASDISGNVLNLAGLSGAGFLKLNYGGSGVLDQFNFSTTSPSGYNISLTPNQTSNYPVTQGVYGIYVFTSGVPLNSGSYQSQVAAGYININPELIPNFTGLYFQTIINSDAGIPSPQTYFGASTLTISGSITYIDGISGDQAYKTTRINVLAPGASYISYIELNPTGAFIGATLNYIISMPASPSPALYFYNANGGIILEQQAISGGGNVFVQLGFDGTYWQVNQWA